MNVLLDLSRTGLCQAPRRAAPESKRRKSPCSSSTEGLGKASQITGKSIEEEVDMTYR